jgi:predicted RecB family nuclease
VQKVSNSLRFSASDLVGHVDCQHLTILDLAAASGKLEKPKPWDPLLQILAERGLAHERQYVDHLRQVGYAVVEIEGSGGIEQARVDKTLEAMRAGAAIIVQGGFIHGDWSGRTDILKRIERPSALGAWSYEVIDTKLARRTKGATLLQLSLYSELLSNAQGCSPEYMHVVKPGSSFEPESFRTSDFGAYYRWAKAGFSRFLTDGSPKETYPEPNEHCDLCAWRKPCAAQRRTDDHLCLVAGISKLQIGELNRRQIETTTVLAGIPIPISWKPDRGSAQTYERVREQARIQVAGRTAGKALYETLDVQPELGLTRLPAPSAGDIFLDFEGDPFVDEGGLEYLFGYVTTADDGEAQYHGYWALTRHQEKDAFTQFVDFVMERWKTYPDLHIYHYAPYEPSALKRLMGRYATREEEIDRMLRAWLFVDLYHVVRQGIRASIERYSIKELESLFGFTRATPLEDASSALATLQALLETGDPALVTEEVKAVVLGYNRDDCLSAQALRSWLETVRAQLIEGGVAIDRPVAPSGDASAARGQWQIRMDALIARLTENVPAEVRERSPEQQAQWILAYILDWHRREEKAVWWEYFRLSALANEDLLEEKAGLANLTFIEAVGGTAKAPIHRYRFPPQEMELRGGEQLHQRGGPKFGSIERISLEERTVDIKKRKDTASIHPESVFSHDVIGTGVLAEALARIGEHVADHGITELEDYGAARGLLLRQPPQLGAEPLRLANETALATAIRIAAKLQGGVLPVQGPPGTGKTHIGARMIYALVKSGAKVGITATSHKVIRNLLNAVLEAGTETGELVRCIQKVDGDEDDLPQLHFTGDNDELFQALHGQCSVAGGTAWLWARPEAQDSVDVLFVDEAAQMSLANVLAVSHAGKTLVLLGDPQQLDQPTKGTHPEGTSVSALDYILHGQQTIRSEQGLFLGQTWRLHPEICAFTSEMFYEGRLTSTPGLELQEVRSHGRVQGSGLRTVLVTHKGNQSSAPEEAEVVRELVRDVLDSAATWIDRKGVERPILLCDILIIAPYNAQVFELQDRIPGARVGTVDKFQGQEAPIVIYSMATSTHADAPRGMSFLYSLNRLNVATSRARCLSVLVCSPDLFEPECRTPQQMQMANAFCRYSEMAIKL